MGFASAYRQPAQPRSSSGSLYQPRMICRRSRWEIASCSGSSERSSCSTASSYSLFQLFALQGELPIELSTRGARYAEASAAVEELKARLSETERALDETVDFIERVSTLD